MDATQGIRGKPGDGKVVGCVVASGSNIRDKIAHADSEGLGDSHQRVDRYIRFTALDLPNVIRMKVRKLG